MRTILSLQMTDREQHQGHERKTQGSLLCVSHKSRRISQEIQRIAHVSLLNHCTNKLRKRKQTTPSHGLKKGDAEKLKTNHGYFLKFYRDKPFEVFVYRSKAVIKHHFNNHEFWGRWCRFSNHLPDNI